MRQFSIYPVAAIVLPVALGLGLIYLYCVGRIDALTAIATVVALGGLLAGAAFLSKIAADDRRPRGHGWGVSGD
mgnify:CR=1 FL=1